MLVEKAEKKVNFESCCSNDLPAVKPVISNDKFTLFLNWPRDINHTFFESCDPPRACLVTNFLFPKKGSRGVLPIPSIFTVKIS